MYDNHNYRPDVFLRKSLQDFTSVEKEIESVTQKDNVEFCFEHSHINNEMLRITKQYSQKLMRKNKN